MKVFHIHFLKVSFMPWFFVESPIARIGLNNIILQNRFPLFPNTFFFLLQKLRKKTKQNKLPEALETGVSRVVWLQPRAAQWVSASFPFIVSPFPSKHTQSPAWLSGFRLQFHNFSTVCGEEIEMQTYPLKQSYCFGV